jgi:asparagine synthase (glutamine-hydrolysing)
MGFRTDPGKEHLSEDLYWAERAAQVFGSRHHPIVIDRRHDPKILLPIALRQFDEPTLTPNCYSKFLLSEAARREGVDSAMSGSCAGPCFQQPSLKHIRKMRAAAGEDATREELILSNRTKLFSFDEQAELLASPDPRAREMALEIVKRFSKGVEAPAFGDFMNGTLVRMQAEKSIGVQDRTSVVNGVELRHPFHDAGLLRFANTIPPRFKGSESDDMQKAVLTAAFKDMLPEEIVTRKKAGFPSYYWTNGEVDELKRELLSPAALARVGLFRPDTVQRILDADTASTKKSAGQRTWGILVMQAWFERYIHGNEALFDVIQHA